MVLTDIVSSVKNNYFLTDGKYSVKINVIENGARLFHCHFGFIQAGMCSGRQPPAVLPTSWAPSLFGSQCRLRLSAAATCLKYLLLQLAENKENFLNEMHRKLFSAEVADGIVEERLLKTVVHYVLEEIALVTLCVAHLAENLAVATHDTLDCIV